MLSDVVSYEINTPVIEKIERDNNIVKFDSNLTFDFSTNDIFINDSQITERQFKFNSYDISAYFDNDVVVEYTIDDFKQRITVEKGSTKIGFNASKILKITSRTLIFMFY